MRKYIKYLIVLPMIIYLVSYIFELINPNYTLFTTYTITPMPNYPNYTVSFITINWTDYIENINGMFAHGFLDNLLAETPVGNFGADVGHNFTLIANWIIYLINLVLTPIRAGTNILGGVLTLLGLNIYNLTETDGFLYWVRVIIMEPINYLAL